jgi:dolichol-phosphate mannosyltransferase
MRTLSLIFPCYNEQENIGILYERVCETIDELKQYEFELIFVNDCSSDETFRGYRVVWGVRQKRAGETPLTRAMSRWYYKAVNWLTNVQMPPLGADVFIADRLAIDSFNRTPEKHTSVFILLAWLGFAQSSVPYVKEARRSGQSKWTIGKKITLLIDSILSFSDIPIRYISLLGVFTALIGFLGALLVLWDFFVNGIPVAGWTSLIVAILLIGGIQMIMLGVLGEYMWRTFDEARKRPRYIIESLHGIDPRDE